MYTKNNLSLVMVFVTMVCVCLCSAQVVIVSDGAQKEEVGLMCIKTNMDVRTQRDINDVTQ